MKILLTGASGFVGAKLLVALTEQYGAENISILSSKKNPNYMTVLYNGEYKIGLENKSQLELVDVLIHAGAFIPKASTDANQLKGCNSNILVTEQLLNINFRNLKKIIFLSTVDVYGPSALIDEKSSLNPRSLYGMSKLYCEKMITTYCEKLKVDNIVLRVGHIYGPGEEKYQKVLPVTIKKLIRDEPVVLWGEGLDLRSFIYIDDVVQAVIRAIALKEKIGLINVVGGVSISIRELVKKLLSLMELNKVIGKKKISTAPVDLVFDNSLVKKYLLPYEIPLDSGLRAEIKHMKEML
jgi:UDP-glucose 4-epimerase